MSRIYVQVKRDSKNRNCQSLMLVMLSLVVAIIVSLFMRGAYTEAREELIERLGREREIVELNQKLKMELAGITRARYMEFKARERLGLKKPKDDEVLVLR
jgi:hypothetical protein